ATQHCALHTDTLTEEHTLLKENTPVHRWPIIHVNVSVLSYPYMFVCVCVCVCVSLCWCWCSCLHVCIRLCGVCVYVPVQSVGCVCVCVCFSHQRENPQSVQHNRWHGHRINAADAFSEKSKERGNQ